MWRQRTAGAAFSDGGADRPGSGEDAGRLTRARAFVL